MRYRARSADRVIVVSPTAGTAERYALTVGPRAQAMAAPEAEAWATDYRAETPEGDVIDVVVVATDLQWAVVRAQAWLLLDRAACGPLPVRLVIIGRPIRWPLVDGPMADVVRFSDIPIVRLDPRGRYPSPGPGATP